MLLLLLCIEHDNAHKKQGGIKHFRKIEVTPEIVMYLLREALYISVIGCPRLQDLGNWGLFLGVWVFLGRDQEYSGPEERVFCGR